MVNTLFKDDVLKQTSLPVLFAAANFTGTAVVINIFTPHPIRDGALNALNVALHVCLSEICIKLDNKSHRKLQFRTLSIVK